MKAKLFVNGSYCAALYTDLDGLSVAMFRRGFPFEQVANRYLGSVCDAVRFLRDYKFRPLVPTDNLFETKL
ncbi:MAG: hypothetical protein HUK04_00365 [Bacteroidaceae bacterium]|nr:hypothetical protein [Bacteroidaceae bacterium]